MPANRFNVGDPVVVRIKYACDYAAGVADALEGATGRVVEHKPTNYLGLARGSEYLVQFDDAVKLHPGRVMSGFWFDDYDLVARPLRDA